MKKAIVRTAKNKKFPVIVERDEDGFYVVQCTVLNGCFTQGKTLDEALKNIREVIGLCLEEKENRDLLASYRPRELSLHTISL
ncbi:MAG: hypothetical protein COV91_00710 [Candidatus Taylorbacteria bacterium CG11_big_fil_rev_8_21_14_0_20_46_11]|uniref:HicB-like antitoxin of toxin-antitoxin system domain-containing protein n=1 Tax=Candidatus Taylorbacteria bacterium CG11_big_fil_rev_8_21_14_0_20_46_11 TaxID=1975025 RepID=A0A2H0KCU0_9BACT|nr:MAG: hypothetical protein COV91_00710 [Candidatus Taylorbacteria bacterium CG11_big_fil_rev_8_21_14_0_20_46_11]